MEAAAPAKPPRVLLMGARRWASRPSRRSSSTRCPHETLFIEAPNKIVKSDANSSFVQFEVWDFPGVDTSSEAVKPEATYGGCGAIVWVIDAQDDHAEAIARLQAAIVTAHASTPASSRGVRAQGGLVLRRQRIECQREIQNQLNEELATARVSGAKLSFHLTSIYDHSVFEAFSKVVQQLIPQLPTLESLLDVLVTSCRIDKAFLFDVVSKIYVATDSSPVDMQSYELCADMIDAVIDVSSIYGLTDDGAPPAPESNCVITLSNPQQDDGTVIYLREANRSSPSSSSASPSSRSRAARVQLQLLPRLAR